MTTSDQPRAGSAWYSADRGRFLNADQPSIVAELASAAAAQGWHIEPQQHEEWDASVGILQNEMRQDTSDEVAIIRQALEEIGLSVYRDVILEYDFRRRGLRIDCVLLGDGIIAVLEFKRSALTPADVDQVTNYCVNLVEFHEETRRLCEEEGAVVIPVLIQTRGTVPRQAVSERPFHEEPWDAVLQKPLRCDREGLGRVLSEALLLRKARSVADRKTWLKSRFSPSSTILDAAISLFGAHEVSAIAEHAGSIERIESMIDGIRVQIQQAQSSKRNRIVLVSGAPGAGKTLVGLRLAFDPSFRDDAVFVTGNAPLVDVLSAALKRSYRNRSARSNSAIAGYPHRNVRFIVENSTFKIVKAHHFLGERGQNTASSDGRIVIFDEAQRTYEKGRMVLSKRLEDHEADLILSSLEASYEAGAVVVALLGHNQAINRGERGAIAWLEAAEERGWDFAVADETLSLGEFEAPERWQAHPRRIDMDVGHLSHSMRFYRNGDVEAWVHCVMEDDYEGALQLSRRLAKEGHNVWLTRDLAAARSWARRNRVGDERAGLIASGQGRRLAAEGLFVDHKPSIAQWMLAPSGDVRSSNMLETVQNQYQIQGLELDYTIVCWDADLRRSEDGWEAWKVSGKGWQRDKALDIAKNSYRVLLTRARKGMMVFVPLGDETHVDTSRETELYDEIAEHLVRCGAEKWVAGTTPGS
jgi:hypothetical protein